MSKVKPVYYDNTRLSDYKDCPRKFYFRHILGIVPEGTAPALVFGLSWHEAMDAIWQSSGDSKLTDEEVMQAGINAFTQEWTTWGYPMPEEVDEEWASLLKFRTVETAIEMIYCYIKKYRERIRGEYEVLAIEQPFAVPLYESDHSVWYVGRLDKVYRWRGQLWIGEHKTSSLYAKATIVRNDFIESFDPNSQVDGYIHAGHMFWPDEKFTGVMVDAALVHGNVHDGFKLIPIMKRDLMLDEWIAETRSWIDSIEEDKAALKGGSSNSRIPFRRNTNQCVGKYGLCPYHPICKVHPAPMKEDNFPGYRVEKWEPFSILKLEKIGMKEED